MNTKLILGSVLVAVVVLGGCVSSGSSKAPTAKAAKAPTAKEIVARYEQALYGKDGLKKHPSMTMKGTLTIEQYNMEAPFVRYAMAPDSNVSTVEVMGMKLSNGCHKGECWSQQPGGGTTVLTGNVAALQLQQSDYALWQHMDRYYTAMEIVEPTDGKESPNYKIKAVKKSGDTDYYEFSKASGLLVAGTIEGDTPQGHMTIAMQFKGYKDFDGMLMPTELTQSMAQGTIKLNFTDVSFAPVPEANFAKPN
jgi:hypothetical protein